MKYLLFLIPLLLLTACTSTPTTLEEELEQLDIPWRYTIYQESSNSGFAGAPDTGAYDEAVEFSVEDGEITQQTGNTTQPLLLMVDLKESLWQYVGDVESDNGTTKRCYSYTQWGVEKMDVCFGPLGIHSYDTLKTMGNHQSEEVHWKLMVPID